MDPTFVYNGRYRLLICTTCGSGIKSDPTSQARHLRKQPHWKTGASLKLHIQSFRSYDIATIEDLRPPTAPVMAIEGLRKRAAYCCCHCSARQPSMNLEKIMAHISSCHGVKPRLQEEGRDWRKACVQTFFAETKDLHYFEVDDIPGPTGMPADDISASPTTAGLETFLANMEATLTAATGSGRLDESAVLTGFGASRTEVVSWLQRTGIEGHLCGLPKARIVESYRVPGATEDTERDLHILLRATTAVLTNAHGLCVPGQACRLSWPTQVLLAKFYESNTEGSSYFAVCKSESTLSTYFGYWRSLMVYCYRVAFARDEDSYWFPDSDRPADVVTPGSTFVVGSALALGWADVRECLAIGDEEVAVEKTMTRLPDFFRALICVQTGTHRYGSIILSFAAMLSIKPTTKTWKAPGNFNSSLSGLIWVSQLILFYHSVLLEDTNADAPQPPGIAKPGTHEFVRRVCRKYMRQTEETPMGEILSWRLLLFKVSKTTVQHRATYWNEGGDVLTYGDTALHLGEIPELLRINYAAAQQTLYEDLMFSTTSLPRRTGLSLKDNLDYDRPHGYFYEFNKTTMSCTELLRKVCLVPMLAKNFFVDGLTEAESPTFSVDAIRIYEDCVQCFLRRLLVLIHVGSGQPLRAPEILSTRWKNTENHRRNIFIVDGRVMIHTTYHKGLNMTGQTKDNIRFLPMPIGELLLDFLCYVQPLRLAFGQAGNRSFQTSPYLWSVGDKVWADEQLSRCMRESCRMAGVPILHSSNWRQMTVAIVKSKFGKDQKYFTNAQGEQAEGNDDDLEGMNMQRNHSTLTANLAYANEHSSAGIWDGLMQAGLRASLLWADLFKIESTLRGQDKKRRKLSEGGGSDVDLIKRIAIGRPRKRRVWKGMELEAHARKLLNDSRMRWKSKAQATALEMVMLWTEVVIAVLPTGGGKSLIFMLPCTLPDAKVTVLIVPMVALRMDMVRRLKVLGIQHAIWSATDACEAPLVMVSIEAAVTREFRSYAQRLIALQRLDRIVIDECHLTLTASSYRPAMVNLANLRELSTQFVYLTATLPILMEDEFKKQQYITNARVVRASVDRPNIKYDVVRDIGFGILLPKSVRFVRIAWEQGQQTGGYCPEDKCIVYCRTIEMAEQVAELLCCPLYTSKSGDEAAKEYIISSWLNNHNCPCIVATSALGIGFDYAHIRMVVHVDAPTSMMDFSQETGRAGRDGLMARSIVLLPVAWKPTLGNNTSQNTDSAAMSDYLTTALCRRASLSRCLDPLPHVEQCAEGPHRCDNCSGRSRAHAKERAAYETVVESEPDFSGALAMRLALKSNDALLRHLREDLVTLKGTCLLCRVRGRWDFDHAFERCRHRYPFFEAKKARERQTRRLRWFQPYTACYNCALPQALCVPQEVTTCEFRDMLMPLCWGMYELDPTFEWFYQTFARRFDSCIDYLQWLGSEAMFAGQRVIKGVLVMTAIIKDMELSGRSEVP